MIRRCERDNLFVVSLDGQGAWYRYHHLFADALRERLGRTATEGELDDLHRRASEWLEENGYFEDAIRHAIAGHDWDRAVRLLENLCAELFDHDHVADAAHLAPWATPHVLRTSPRLAFWLAWAQGERVDGPAASQSLRIAEEAWTANDDRQGEGLGPALACGPALVTMTTVGPSSTRSERSTACRRIDPPNESSP